MENLKYKIGGNTYSKDDLNEERRRMNNSSSISIEKITPKTNIYNNSITKNNVSQRTEVNTQNIKETIKTLKRVESIETIKNKQTQVSYNGHEFSKSIGYEAKKSIKEVINSYYAKPLPDLPPNTTLIFNPKVISKVGNNYSGKILLSDKFKQGISSSGSDVLGKLQNSFSSDDSFSNSMGSTSLMVGTITFNSFKTTVRISEVATPATVSLIKKVPGFTRNSYDFLSTVGKTSISIGSTVVGIRNGFIPLSQAKKSFLLNMSYYNVASSYTYKNIANIANKVKNIPSGVITLGGNIKTGFVHTKNGAVRTYKLVRDMSKSVTLTGIVAHDLLLKANYALYLANRNALKFTTRGIIKGSALAIHKGIPSGIRFSNKLSLAVADVLGMSGDPMLQTTGTIIKASNYTVKTANVATKVTYRTVKTATKTTVGLGKSIYFGVKYLRNYGFKAGLRNLGQKTLRAVTKAGGSVFNAIIELAKTFVKKLAIPIAILVIVFGLLTNIIAAPAAAVSSFFSGFFDLFKDNSTYYTTADIKEFLTNEDNGIDVKREKFIDDFVEKYEKKLRNNGGSVDYFSIRINGRNVSLYNLKDNFYSSEDILNIIQYIFNAIIIQKHEMKIKESDANNLFNNIFNNLFKIVEEDIETEFCESIECEECGIIIAESYCPNTENVKHETFTCSVCCDNICPGHEKNGKTVYDDCGSKFVCNGHNICSGHDTMNITISTDGLITLIYDNFENNINSLLEKDSLTSDEKQKLNLTKDTYLILQEMIKELNLDYGINLSKSVVYNTTFIKSETRNPNNDIVKFALSLVNIRNPQKIFDYFGVEKWTNWNTHFVNYVIEKTNNQDTYSFNSIFNVQSLWDEFGKDGRQKDRTYTDIVPGDIIFINWQADKGWFDTGFGTSPDQIEIVIGLTNDYVYTVGGCRSNNVYINKYKLDSLAIYGYGITDY